MPPPKKREPIWQLFCKSHEVVVGLKPLNIHMFISPSTFRKMNKKRLFEVTPSFSFKGSFRYISHTPIMAWIVQAAVLFALPVTRAVANVRSRYGEKEGLEDVGRGESVPSRELTYPPDKAYLKMIFLFPRWYMLISWRVSVRN